MHRFQAFRLITAIFAALAMTVFVDSRAAFSQDAADSGSSAAYSSTAADSGGTADSGVSVDSDWDRVDNGPAIDQDAASADKVLEIPQAKCSSDDESSPCEANTGNNDNADDDGAINAPSPGAPPQTFDESTASNDPDWGSVDDYQNQQAYNVPYVVMPYPVYAYSTGPAGPYSRPSQFPRSSFAPMSSPLTQAARPLGHGPWMTPPSMSIYSRPAGSPMMMAAPMVGFHR